MLVRKPGFLAKTCNGTIYVGVPSEDGFRVRRCRVLGRTTRGPQVREFRGPVAALGRGIPVAPHRTATCGSHLFSVQGDAPVEGALLAVGGTFTGDVLDLSKGEVSTTITQVQEIPVDRLWIAEPLIRAYRNGDDTFAGMLVEQEFEHGDEGIEDESGVLSAGVLEAFYQKRLLAKAAERQESASRNGMTVTPRGFTVSNEDLEAMLAAAASSPSGEAPHLGDAELCVVGDIEGMRLVGDAVLASADALLAAMQGLEVLPRVVNTTNAGLAVALAAAPGPGMTKARFPLKASRQQRGRIATGLDQMLASMKRWTDAPEPPSELSEAA